MKENKINLFSKETRGNCHQSLFKENIKKTPKRRSANFEKKRFRSCLYIGKVLALPHTRYKE